MGYVSEPSDDDGNYDIFVLNMGSGNYGFCVDEGDGVSYLKIDNDYNSGYSSNFGQTPIKIMQISIAHEYFHAIQYGYQHNYGSGSGSDAYFYEMSATWIEDVIVPDGNDYLENKWVDQLLDNPEGEFDNRWPVGCNDNCDGRGYELALFGHYLSSFIDPGGYLNEKQSTIINKIWTEYSDSYISSNDYDKPLVVIDRILQSEYQISFIEAWTDFISRNLYNGIDESFYYYSDQSLIDPITTSIQVLSDSPTFSIELDDKSAAIQSYQLGELNALLNINHSPDEYLGRISIVSVNDYNDIFWGIDTSGLELVSNSEIHFVYGSDNQGESVTVHLITSYYGCTDPEACN